MCIEFVLSFQLLFDVWTFILHLLLWSLVIAPWRWATMQALCAPYVWEWLFVEITCSCPVAQLFKICTQNGIIEDFFHKAEVWHISIHSMLLSFDL